MKCTSTGRPCEGYEVSALPSSRRPPLLPKGGPKKQLAIALAPTSLPSAVSGSDAHAFDFFRVKTAPSLAGHFSANVWEKLVLQLSQRHQLIFQASVAVGALGYFRSSGPGCLARSKTAKSHYDVALTNYGKAINGLRSYIETASGEADEEVGLVVLVSCLLFICFEMLQGDQTLVISHLVKGLKVLFTQYKPTTCISASMRPVVLGNDFPDAMDSLVDVFVRLDADSTMLGRRSTFLCTTCRCCCQGSEIKLTHGFRSIQEARSHLDLLTSTCFTLRGKLLNFTERLISSKQSGETWTSASAGEDWATRYCHLYARSRTIDLSGSVSGAEIVAKQKELKIAFAAWTEALADLANDADELSITMLRIQHFFAYFIVSTLRDEDETKCDRFYAAFAEVVNLAGDYMERTQDLTSRCGFALESGILRSLYIVGLKCRDSHIRRRAVELLRNSTVQEGLWSGRIFAAYLTRVIHLEETQARRLRPDIREDVSLTYQLVPDKARFRDIVLVNDDTRPLVGRIVCARPVDNDYSVMELMEDAFPLLTS